MLTARIVELALSHQRFLDFTLQYLTGGPIHFYLSRLLALRNVHGNGDNSFFQLPQNEHNGFATVQLCLNGPN